MMRTFPITALLMLLFTIPAFAQINTLQHSIEQLLATKNAVVGVSICGIESGDSLAINKDGHFPLQSVFKFHIALAILNQVDKGKFSLAQKIYLPKKELLPDTWSPLREKYPAGNIAIPLAEMLRYTVSESDNNGCDILLRLIGGPKKVNDYIHSIGISDVAITANEAAMHKEWNVQFTNWTTPAASTELLKIFFERKILSTKSYDFLWKLMTATSTGKDRIKGQLPAGTFVAHKTGSSDTNEQGITAATNDTGIVTLPDGRHFAIAVFVSASRENTATNEKIIADIAKLAWDYFVRDKN